MERVKKGEYNDIMIHLSKKLKYEREKKNVAFYL